MRRMYLIIILTIMVLVLGCGNTDGTGVKDGGQQGSEQDSKDKKQAGQSGTGAGQSGTGAGQSGTGAGQSGTGAGQSGTGAGQSGTGAGQSGTGAGQSGTGAGQSGTGAGQSGTGAGQSGTGAGQSGTGAGQSGTGAGQSGTGAGQSGTGAGQSGTGAGQSGTGAGQSGGTQERGDEVTTAQQFKYKLTRGESFTLGSDIELENWETVEKYSGTLDGNNKKLTIKFKADAIGLIRFIEPSGEVKDLTIELREDFSTNNTDIEAAGPLAGTNKGKVEGVKVIGSGKVINGNKDAATGGLIGINHATGEVVKCSSEVGVDGGQMTGGLVGLNDMSPPGAVQGGTITNSYATGDVEGTNHVGGLVGYSKAGRIENSYATGDVKGNNNIGGFVGKADNTGEIDKCYSRAASVTGTSQVGRFAGWVMMLPSQGSKASITNSFVMEITSPEKNVGVGPSTGVTAKEQSAIRANTFTDVGWSRSVWKNLVDSQWPQLAWQK